MGGVMNREVTLRVAAYLCAGLLATATAGAQSFGTAKEKVTLLRRLPALVHLPGDSIAVRVTGHDERSDLVRDLQSMLETELTKDDPRLRIDERAPSAVISCRITEFAHPPPTVTARPSLAVGKNAPKTQNYLRVTGSLSIAFQTRGAGGAELSSDNVTAKYDREFDSVGNTASEGVKGTVSSTWKRITGGAGSEDLNPPTDAELRIRLINEAVQKIAAHIVNTRETVEVYLAKQRGALDEGDKLAMGGLWERALETFENATPNPKPTEDAYRLYNTGVAYEALAYKAEDPKAAMKYLDEAAIDYGKAIDSRPGEKYFLEPQRRIEDAIAHYRQLEQQRHPAPQAASVPSSSGASGAGGASKAGAGKALTNEQVIAMVKAGMDDDTVSEAIRSAKAVSFNLTAEGQKALTDGGASAAVLAAMKTRASATHTTPAHTTTSHPAATRAVGGSTAPK
jgi:tetratricopeptide (TPR) repeat protein